MPVVKVDVRFSDNVLELKERIAAGTGAMEGLKQSVNRTAESIGGQGLFIQANRLGLAIEQVGGVTKLTSAEIDRHSATLDKAIEKYKVMGMTAPPAMVALAEAMHPLGTESEKLGAHADDLKTRLEEAFKDPMGAVKSVGASVVSDVGSAMGAAGVAIGAAAAVVGLAGVELMKLGSEAEAIGAKIGRMGQQFNIPVENVSNLRFAVLAAGGDFDAFGDSMFTFQKRIEDNGDAVDKGLHKIGLSVAGIKDMRPDEQFLAISDAIRSSGTEVNKSAIAFEIFGKQGKDILPLLMKPLSDLTEESENLGATWTGQSVAAARAFRGEVTKLAVETEEAWTTLGRTVAPITNEITIGWETLKLWASEAIVFIATSGDKLMNLIGISKDWALAAETAGARQDVINNALKLGAPLGIKFGDAVRYVNQQFDLQKPAADRSSDAAQTWLSTLGKAQHAAELAADADRVLTNGLADQGIVRGAGIDAANEYTTALDKATQEAKKHAAEQHKLAGELLKVEHSLTEIPAELGKIGRSFDESKLGKIADEVGKIEQNAHITNFGFEGMTEALKHVGMAGEDTARITKELDAAFTFVGPVQQRIKTLGQTMADVFKAVPQMVANAFTGGGGIMGAVQGIGSMAASTIGEKLGKGISALGQMGGPIGAAIGSLAGPIIGFFANVFSGGAEHLVNPIRQAFVDAAGGIAALDAKAHAAGVTLTAMLNAKNPEQYKKAIDDLNAAFATQKQRIADDNTALATLLSSAQTMGGILPKTFDPAIQKLLEMGSITKDNAKLFSDLTGSTGVDFAKMQDTAKKYGIDLASLGPQFQSARLSDVAKNIINDFDLLTRGGADVGGVLLGMSGNISKLVTDSLKFGTTIPENMHPWIQELARSGHLVDENGNKLTDLSALKFADPIVTEFQKIVNKLQELIDRIAAPGGVIAAVNAIPDNKNVHIGYTYDEPRSGDGNYAALGGLVTHHGVQYLSGGGTVLPFTPRGTDTVPAMLTPGESVLTRGATRELGAGAISVLNRGGRLQGAGGGQIVNFEALRAEQEATRKELRNLSAALLAEARRAPDRTATAVRDALLQARVGRN